MHCHQRDMGISINKPNKRVTLATCNTSNTYNKLIITSEDKVYCKEKCTNQSENEECAEAPLSDSPAGTLKNTRQLARDATESWRTANT